MNFGTGPVSRGQGNETERGDQRGHEDRAEPGHAALTHGGVRITALFAQEVEKADEHQSVQHSHAGEGDEADAGGNSEGQAA